MKSYKFLVPVGVALIAVSGAQASVPTTITIQAPTAAKTSRFLGDPIVQSLSYEKLGEIHDLLMKRSDAGAIYAEHGSHSSHSSHSSHASHRSSAS